MNIKFTDRFTVDENGVLIQRGGTGDSGDGIIPASVEVSAISLMPDATSGTFPDWWVHGSVTGSKWAKVPKESPGFEMSGMRSGEDIYFWVKAETGESFEMNMYIRG